MNLTDVQHCEPTVNQVTMARMKRLMIAVTAVVGCVSTGKFDQLSRVEQSRMKRCQIAIQPAKCGSDKDAMYVEMCIRGARAEYADQATERERKEYLMAYGCPPSMVEPEAHVASEGGDK